MLRDACDDPLLAGAANAELARIIDIDALIEQYAQDGLALGNEEFLAGARKLDREAALARRLRLGREIFRVNLGARPIRGHGLEDPQHRGRAAAIKMRI